MPHDVRKWLRKLILVGVFTACLPLDCSKPGEESAAFSREGKIPTYRLGRWRLSNHPEDALIWISHILIAHRDATADPRLGEVRLDAVPSRSREEARLRAIKIYTAVVRDPTTFSEEAEAVSDDARTRSHGGRLGGLAAADLPATFVDAIEATSWGGITAPIETALGFHILLKGAPPPDKLVRGRRLFLKYRRDQEPSSAGRTRAEALALLNQIVVEHDHGTPFADLIRKYSEGRDRAIDGDTGAVRTRTHARNPMELTVLQRTKVGALTSIVDAPGGIELYERIEPDADSGPLLAMRAIYVPFDENASPQTPLSEQHQHELAIRIAESARRDPETFGRWHERFCCRGVMRVEGPEGDPEVRHALAQLGVGEIGEFVSHAIPQILVFQRVDPDLAKDEPMEPSLAVPIPDWTDVGRIFSVTATSQLISELPAARKILEGFPASGPERAAIGSAFDRLKADLDGSSDGAMRRRAFDLAQSSLYENLSDSSYSSTMDAVQKWVDFRMLKGVTSAGVSSPKVAQ